MPFDCEIGSFDFFTYDEIKPITLQLSTGTEACAWNDPHRGRGHYIGEALDLICRCEHYDPLGVLIYIPALKSLGSCDYEHENAVYYPQISWQKFAADPVRYINSAWEPDKDPTVAMRVNPVGLFPHVGPSGSPVVRVADDHFDVTCDMCGRNIEIRSVSFFEPDQFSYRYSCACGNGLEIDGGDGAGLPDRLKSAAIQRHRTFLIKTEVNEQRRARPATAGKKLLQVARVDPEEQSSGRWLVYDLPDLGKVVFDENAKQYTLCFSSGEERTFDDIRGLIHFLDF